MRPVLRRLYSTQVRFRRPVSLVILSLLALWPGPARSAPPQETPVDLELGVKVPMRDGVTLNATVYHPGGQKEPLPVIFMPTPYTADTYHDKAMYFARHGYVFALVDIRGRGNSGGTFVPFLEDARDAADTVEWLARQPWSNGKVSLWGGSYTGYIQWAALKEFPPHLVTIVPAAAAYPGVDFPISDNIFYSYNVQWLTFMNGLLSNRSLFKDSSFWIQKFRELYLNHRPYRELDRIATGKADPLFQTWFDHPTPGSPYWKAMVPTPEQYRRMDVPILSITGHYDEDQPGALTFYREHMRYGSPEGIAQHYLILGPWDHSGTRSPMREVGGLTFGPASLVNLDELHLQWYDWTMKGGPKPAFLKKRIAYYVAGEGAETWKYADHFDEIAGETRKLYLASEDGKANEVFQSGALADAPPARSEPDRYVYDPLDVRPAQLETQEIRNRYTDQAKSLQLFGNGLVYHSEPFTEPVEISGAVKLSLWIALNVPDTDFQAELWEVLPDGSAALLTNCQLRARYRDSRDHAVLVPPGEVLRYDFSTFTWFSRRIAKGSRLRLLVFSPNSIYFEKNYNAGGAVADESGEDARTAEVTLYHDAEHPSALEIPVVQ